MSVRKEAYLIILVIAVFVVLGLLIANAMKSSENSEQEKEISYVRHYAGLDKVVMPENMVSELKEYEGFVLSFNRDNHTPNWVAWELLGHETEGADSRTNRFWTDEELEGCASTRDYSRSGYDRGHIVPAADQKWSAKAMEDCFVMANICPQDHSLNSGAWNTLEKKTRLWAKRDSALMIVAGPVYDRGDRKRIGESGVRVPGAFFKVIIAPYLEHPRGIGFIYPNMSSLGNMQQYSMTIDEVESITGLDFFSSLPDDIENEVESKTSFLEWDSRK